MITYCMCKSLQLSLGHVQVHIACRLVYPDCKHASVMYMYMGRKGSRTVHAMTNQSVLVGIGSGYSSIGHIYICKYSIVVSHVNVAVVVQL